MPPHLNEPEEHSGAGISAEDPWPVPDKPADANGYRKGDDPDPMSHDDLFALRSSRHVTRRPRRRKRWPWVTALVAIALGAASYGFYLFGWPTVEGFLISRNVDSVAAGYPALATSFSDGVATISGEVETAADAESLVAAMERVEGVDEVRADLRVVVESTDGSLETVILDALAAAGITTVTPIIEGSTVTLMGNVSDPDAIDSASAITVGVDGVSQVLNRVIVASDATSAARQVLDAAGYDAVEVVISENVAVLNGFVPTEDGVLGAAGVVLGLSGIDKVDNRLVVGTPPITTPATVPVGEIDTVMTLALAEAGFENVVVTADGGFAYLDGVVPFDVLEDGYFAFVDDIRSLVEELAGTVTVVNRLRLRGDEQELRTQLKTLLDESPIVFLSGSSDLTIESRATLDAAAQIIVSQPGLQVFIAGHTDSSGTAEANEQLARTRGGEVYGYLVSLGVPANRMVVVSYGELFPGGGASSADDRRIEFEVGP